MNVNQEEILKKLKSLTKKKYKITQQKNNNQNPDLDYRISSYYFYSEKPEFHKKLQKISQIKKIHPTKYKTITHFTRDNSTPKIIFDLLYQQNVKEGEFILYSKRNLRKKKGQKEKIEKKQPRKRTLSPSLSSDTSDTDEQSELEKHKKQQPKFLSIFQIQSQIKKFDEIIETTKKEKEEYLQTLQEKLTQLKKFQQSFDYNATTNNT